MYHPVTFDQVASLFAFFLMVISLSVGDTLVLLASNEIKPCHCSIALPLP